MDQSTNAASKSRPHVLVVDDDEMILALIKVSLAKKYEITLLSHGSEAVPTALKLRPDLIILDLNMPHVDGIEILQQCNSHPYLSTIPVLCLSGDKSGDTRQQTRELGAAGYLVKPIDRKQFCADVENLLEASNLNVHSADKRLSCYVGFNDKSKDEALHDFIERSLLHSRVLVLSPSEGKSFCTESEQNALIDDRLIYLQFRTNVFSKLPFMEDLSPVIADIKSLVPAYDEPLCLVVEDLDLVLDYFSSGQSQAGHVMMINELLRKEFHRLAYFFKRPADSSQQNQLNDLTMLLVGA